MVKKNSSIELLRIISMFFIVLSHCCAHGLRGINSSILVNNIVLDIFELGNLGVAIFLIISGYLSVDRKFKVSKILYLEFITITYSIVFLLITLLTTSDICNTNSIIKSIFPILFENYWFMTAYISLYIFSPFINFLITSLDKSRLFILIGLCIFTFFFIPTFTTRDLYFNELFQFFTFYCIGGCIKLYIDVDNVYNKAKILLVCLVLFTVVSSSVIELVALKNSFFSSYGKYFLNRNSIFVLMIAICIHIIAIRKDTFYYEPINFVSSAMLGVYLIHDNPFVRAMLWDFIDLKRFVDEPYLFLVLILSTFIIIFVCTLVEVLRNKMLDKKFKHIAKIIEKKLFDL